MTKARLPLLLLVVILTVGLVAPVALARDTRSEREQARSKRAQVAKELDGLNASENELLSALAALDAEVAAQSAQLASARQAVASAEAERAEAERSVAETRQRIDTLTGVLVDRAVDTFIHPEGTPIDELVQSRDITEAARKQAFLDQMAARDGDVIDQFNAARQDFEIAQAQAAEAKAKADERRAQAESHLAELESARAAKAELKAQLDARQAALLAEVESLAQSEAELTRIIQEADASRSPGGGAVRGGTPDLRPGSGGCIWPARGTVTSGFGMRWGRLHAGIDIAAPTGTPIWAAKAGTVIFAGVQGGFGNVVIIDHGGGFTTVYAHQSRLGSRSGQSVGQGDTIGFVGSTGNSTGPHVHFETRYGGSPRDPRGCL